MSTSTPAAKKARLLGLGAGLTLTGVVVAAAAIPWLRPSSDASTAVSTAGLGPVIRNDAASNDGTPSSDTVQSPTEPATKPADDEASLPSRLAGVWRLEKHGTRTITILPDGTATAIVRLDFVGALLYGEELSLRLTWSLEGDVMTQTVTGGEPADAVARLVNDWGAERTYQVVEANDRRLVLAELDDDNDRDVWTAVAPAADSDGTASTTK